VFRRESLHGKGAIYRLCAVIHRACSGNAVPLIVIAFFFAFSPPTIHAQTESPSAVSSTELDRRIDEVIHERKYAWRLPRGEAQPKTEQGIVVRFLSAIGNMVSRAVGRVVDWIEELIRWLFSSDETRRRSFFGSLASSQGLLFLLLAIVLSALALFLIRVRNNRRKQIAFSPVVLQPIPDLTDENTAADQLPEQSWSKLGRELIERGEFRLAMRAFYLSSLVRLSQHHLIAIARFKSNRDYEIELRRRAHAFPNLLQHFSENLKTFERIWYGDHTVDRELADQFAASVEKIQVDA
jgi:hypothetical protein